MAMDFGQIFSRNDKFMITFNVKTGHTLEEKRPPTTLDERLTDHTICECDVSTVQYIVYACSCVVVFYIVS